MIGTSGAGSYQLTTTILREVDLGPCVPGPKTLCIDDAPGDGRFEATIAFDTSQAGGQGGLGNAIELDSLGISSGGVFWFFNRENPEVLLKVLNGCGVNGHYWVFWSAGTNVRMVVTVTDRRTGRQRIYQNPDLTPGSAGDRHLRVHLLKAPWHVDCSMRGSGGGRRPSPLSSRVCP